MTNFNITGPEFSAIYLYRHVTTFRHIESFTVVEREKSNIEKEFDKIDRSWTSLKIYTIF